MPSLIHKVVYIFCSLFVLTIALVVAISLFSSGVKIFFFGLKLMLVPLLFLAIAYIAWHAGRFIRKVK